MSLVAATSKEAGITHELNGFVQALEFVGDGKRIIVQSPAHTLGVADEEVDASVFVERALNSEGLRCVVLLGCSSWYALAETFVRRGVPAVGGTDFNIPSGLPNVGLASFFGELARSSQRRSESVVIRPV